MTASRTPPSPDEQLLTVADLLAAGEPERARGHARRVVNDGSIDPRVRARAAVMESSAFLTEGNRRGALDAADRGRALDPGFPEAWLAAGLAAYRLGAMPEAEVAVRRCSELAPADARAWYLLGRVLVWTSGAEAGDAAIRRAAALAPHRYIVPTRVGEAEFDGLCRNEWNVLPNRLTDRLADMDVVVRDLPSVDEVAADVPPDVLGYYTGRGSASTLVPNFRAAGMEMIVLFQRNIEAVSPTLDRLVANIRTTLRHEVGHRFGMNHADLHSAGL
jgi:predicted Zn-dependent protease with MMP-like domain